MNAEHFAEAARKPVYAAVIPVAGLGTRTFPASIATPKNLLPALESPLIMLAVEEALEAGIQKVVIVCGPGDQPAYEKLFQKNPALEEKLAKGNKTRELAVVRKLAEYADHITYVVQDEPKGLGHAIYQARDHINKLPFAVILPDDHYDSGKHPGALSQMMDVYRKHGGNIMCSLEVPEKDVSRYGIVQYTEGEDGIAQVSAVKEKPKSSAEVGGSRLAIMGRDICQPELMDILATQEPTAGGEIQLRDAQMKLLQQPGQAFYAVEPIANRYDYGSIEGRIEAEVQLGLREHPEYYEKAVRAAEYVDPDSPLAQKAKAKQGPAPLPPGFLGA
ncbi:MAG TPA: sugar phosphate nucleotidyltransferase [Patescibacteria group bacterium]|nr:sugar phosphate nucleotidyltransferase [Patescibacteria group bacterium]